MGCRSCLFAVTLFNLRQALALFAAYRQEHHCLPVMSRSTSPYEVAGRSFELPPRGVYGGRRRIEATCVFAVEYDEACPIVCGRLNDLFS